MVEDSGADHTTAETQARILEFLEVMRRLRAECSWKASQTHRSLVRYLLEETHEAVEAIETGDAPHLREELGDLLLQVWFHSVIAEEHGDFTFDDVVEGIVAKLRRRNPHVFGDAPGGDPATINEMWESIKAEEKPRAEVTDGLPASLPALLYTDKVLSRLARSGHPVIPDSSPGASIGERLIGLVAEAREQGVDPEQALREAVRARLDPTSATSE